MLVIIGLKLTGEISALLGNTMGMLCCLTTKTQNVEGRSMKGFIFCSVCNTYSYFDSIKYPKSLFFCEHFHQEQ